MSQGDCGLLLLSTLTACYTHHCRLRQLQSVTCVGYMIRATWLQQCQIGRDARLFALIIMVISYQELGNTLGPLYTSAWVTQSRTISKLDTVRMHYVCTASQRMSGHQCWLRDRELRPTCWLTAVRARATTGPIPHRPEPPGLTRQLPAHTTWAHTTPSRRAQSRPRKGTRFLRRATSRAASEPRVGRAQRRAAGRRLLRRCAGQTAEHLYVRHVCACVAEAAEVSAEFERGGGAQLQKGEGLVAAVGRRGWGVPSSIPDANTAPREGAAHTHAAGDHGSPEKAEHEPDALVNWVPERRRLLELDCHRASAPSEALQHDHTQPGGALVDGTCAQGIPQQESVAIKSSAGLPPSRAKQHLRGV